MTKCFGCRGVVFSRDSELQNELAEFVHGIRQNWSNLFQTKDWISRLAYLDDVFAMFNEINTSMQTGSVFHNVGKDRRRETEDRSMEVPSIKRLFWYVSQLG